MGVAARLAGEAGSPSPALPRRRFPAIGGTRGVLSAEAQAARRLRPSRCQPTQCVFSKWRWQGESAYAADRVGPAMRWLTAAHRLTDSAFPRRMAFADEERPGWAGPRSWDRVPPGRARPTVHPLPAHAGTINETARPTRRPTPCHRDDGFCKDPSGVPAAPRIGSAAGSRTWPASAPARSTSRPLR